ncbi:MAG: FAD-dependent monooxygenase [Pseudomonadota bacterium]
MDRSPPPLRADIVIAGAGLAGLAAAAAFGRAGFSTLLIAPSLPVSAPLEDGADLRSTAVLEPAVAFLDEIGVWSRLAPHATDLKVMRLADAGENNALRTVADFEAPDLARERFGVNLPNWLFGRELAAHLSEEPNVRTLTGRQVAGLVPRSRAARLRLDDGTLVETPLVIAADGRRSLIRQRLRIPSESWDYGQTALVFAVSHPQPHDNISTEIHRSGGPFTLVPLPDRDGRPHSAVVWMEHAPEAERLRALPARAFSAAATQRSGGILGALTLAGRIGAFPIAALLAHRFDGPRTALIAEAAHAMPPVGAQGLNLSLGDIATLRDLAKAAREAGRDWGAPDLLARYTRRRRPEAALRVFGVDLLNRFAMTDSPGLRALRHAGLRTLHRVPPLRQAAMRLGLGA